MDSKHTKMTSGPALFDFQPPQHKELVSFLFKTLDMVSKDESPTRSEDIAKLFQDEAVDVAIKTALVQVAATIEPEKKLHGWKEKVVTIASVLTTMLTVVTFDLSVDEYWKTHVNTLSVYNIRYGPPIDSKLWFDIVPLNSSQGYRVIYDGKQMPFADLKQQLEGFGLL
jgi:hypothetical protein